MPNLVLSPPHQLVLALQYWSGDEGRAMRLARLLADIEPEPRDDVIFAFCRRFDQPETELSWETMLYVGQKFRTTRIRSAREGTGHPSGCNELWAGTMEALAGQWAAGGLTAHSVFTFEADGIPLRGDWIDRLIEAHKLTLESRKRITGSEMNRFPHLNGSLVAHLSLWADRPSLHQTPPDQAWDLFHAASLLGEARTTREILNVYGACEWSSASLEAVGKETAWLASQKDDSALAWAERALPAKVRRRPGRATLLQQPPGEPRHYAVACPPWQFEILVGSMRRHCQPFVLHLLAWDWAVEETIGRRVGLDVRATHRYDLIGRHSELCHLPGPPRGGNESNCSVRWTFLCDVMEDTGRPVTLIDGDQFFWSSPEPFFAEVDGADVALSPHGFPPLTSGLPGVHEETHVQHGRFNGGWSYWADIEAAQRMAEYAREWCYVGFREMPSGRKLFGDQGYLELIDEEFGAHVIQHPGVNLAPWNLHARTAALGLQPPISFHYSSLRFDGHRVTQLANPEYAITPEQIHRFYDPYVRELEATTE